MDERRSNDSLMVGLVVLALLLAGAGGFVLFQRQRVEVEQARMQAENAMREAKAENAMREAEMQRMRAEEQESRAKKSLQEANGELEAEAHSPRPQPKATAKEKTREDDPETDAARSELLEGRKLVRQGEVVPTRYRLNPAIDHSTYCAKLDEIRFFELEFDRVLKLDKTELRVSHWIVMKAICAAEHPLPRDELLKQVGIKAGMKDSELSKVIRGLESKRPPLIQGISEAQMVLESGMQKFEKMLERDPAFKSDTNMVDEALMALLYWRLVLQLNGMRIPENYPLKEIWTQHANRISEVREQFKREIGFE